MNTFPLVISTPDGHAWRGEAAMLVVRGVEGELAVMAGHIPFVTPIKPCDCKIVLSDGEEMVGHTEGGLLTVSREGVTLLCGSFRL